MIPIQTLRNGQILEVKTQQLYDSVCSICEEHKRTNRALAFAFILYNYQNPQIQKILMDTDYYRSLHEISGQHLSIFFVKQDESYFGQDLHKHNGREARGLFQLKPMDHLIPMLKKNFDIAEKVEFPAVLFFQEHNGMMVDSFLVHLDGKHIEESFWELKDYIEAAVHELQNVKKENYGNSREIFELLKSGVRGERLKKSLFKSIQKFPVQLFISWIAGKV